MEEVYSEEEPRFGNPEYAKAHVSEVQEIEEEDESQELLDYPEPPEDI